MPMNIMPRNFLAPMTPAQGGQSEGALAAEIERLRRTNPDVWAQILMAEMQRRRAAGSDPGRQLRYYLDEDANDAMQALPSENALRMPQRAYTGSEAREMQRMGGVSYYDEERGEFVPRGSVARPFKNRGT